VRTHRRPATGYFLRAESFFNVATNLEALDRTGFGAPLTAAYGGKSLHEQSHGEAFLSLFLHRFGPSGFYVLDEPEAALSPARQMAVLTRLHDLVKAGSQFVIATHAPIVLAYPDAWIFELGATGVARPLPVPYTHTETVRSISDFLGNRERLLYGLMR
jgi:predicted ATPase